MNSYAQVGQDKSALEWNHGKADGTFLDVGSHDGRSFSNTLALEEVGWNGLLVDIQSFPTLAFRRSPFAQGDSRLLDWDALLKRHFPGTDTIDYLSLDVDESTTDTLLLLLKTPYKFRFATVEHDFYRLGDSHRSRQRKALTDAGYKLVKADVEIPVGMGFNGMGGPFEDHWAFV